jgi:phosphoribosyl 1,2-cyclic phosphodiesterase
VSDLIFESLYSSSSGNAYLVASDNGDTRILLECGVTRRKLQKALNYDIPKHVLVSHSHKDHCQCVNDLIKDGCTIYCSEGTAEELELEGVEIVRHGEQFCIESEFDIVPFDVYHDTKEPLGFVVRCRSDGEILVFATDTVNLGYRFPGVTKLCIEGNFQQSYLDEKLQMPAGTRRRIASTHFEIDKLCAYLRTLDLERCTTIYLLHLSDSCSHELQFVNKVIRAVPPHVKVIACPKETKK